MIKQYIGDTNHLYNFHPSEARAEFQEISSVINSLKTEGAY